MAVKDGARDLPAQLASLNAQSHDNWHLMISDDGSTDESRQIIEEFVSKGHKFRLFDGPDLGAAENFMSLIRALRTAPPNDGYLAFCDQDDVWLPGKIARGIARLPKCQPALYCSRSWITNADLSARRLSPKRPHPPGFRNALVQNIAAGNTIMLNPMAARLIIDAAFEAQSVVMHDWWIYQMITGVGGVVIHDDAPMLLYRQHASNQIGANDGLRAKFWRVVRLLRGDFSKWNNLNIQALQRSAARLTLDNQALLDGFDQMRKAPLLRRLQQLRNLGLYRQSRAGSLSLWLAALMNRL